MSSTADIIRNLLVLLDLGENDGNNWPIFVGFLPNDPDNAICIYDTAGRLDGRIMRSGEQIVHPGIQVRVRASNYLDAQGKVTTIARVLDAQYQVTITLGTESYLVQNISRSSDIFSLGVEDSDRRRHSFTVNATVTIKRKG